ncbi:hypothetical protein ABBQ38_014502 [Trebouxia sp. C0009 RCD-2024]
MPGLKSSKILAHTTRGSTAPTFQSITVELRLIINHRVVLHLMMSGLLNSQRPAAGVPPGVPPRPPLRARHLPAAGFGPFRGAAACQHHPAHAPGPLRHMGHMGMSHGDVINVVVQGSAMTAASAPSIQPTPPPGSSSQRDSEEEDGRAESSAAPKKTRQVINSDPSFPGQPLYQCNPIASPKQGRAPPKHPGEHLGLGPSEVQLHLRAIQPMPEAPSTPHHHALLSLHQAAEQLFTPAHDSPVSTTSQAPLSPPPAAGTAATAASAGTVHVTIHMEGRAPMSGDAPVDHKLGDLLAHATGLPLDALQVVHNGCLVDRAKWACSLAELVWGPRVELSVGTELPTAPVQPGCPPADPTLTATSLASAPRCALHCGCPGQYGMPPGGSGVVSSMVRGRIEDFGDANFGATVVAKLESGH